VRLFGKKRQEDRASGSLIVGPTGACREKPEHSALRAVFLLDDFVTGDESSLERLLGPMPRHGNRVCTYQRQTFQEEGCGIAAALFRWAWCGPAKHSMVPEASGYQLGTS
jgi:hypothetical protein